MTQPSPASFYGIEKASLVLPFPYGYLRPLRPNDVHAPYVDGINDPEVNRYLVTVRDQRQTIESVRAFVNDQFGAPDAVLFGIWLHDHSAHCGTLRLHGIGSAAGVHIGICLFDRTVWGRGIGSAAIATVTDWAFRSIVGLASIEAGAYLENVASWKSFLKAGYVVRAEISDRFERDGQPAHVRCLVCVPPKAREDVSRPSDREAAMSADRAQE